MLRTNSSILIRSILSWFSARGAVLKAACSVCRSPWWWRPYNEGIRQYRGQHCAWSLRENYPEIWLKRLKTKKNWLCLSSKALFSSLFLYFSWRLCSFLLQKKFVALVCKMWPTVTEGAAIFITAVGWSVAFIPLRAPCSQELEQLSSGLWAVFLLSFLP